MITVIKHGQTKFTATCKKCGCEFSYELSDIDSYGNTVKCPDCGDSYYHKDPNQLEPEFHWPPGVKSIKEIKVDDDWSCEGCEFNDFLKHGGTYVGDTPCTWCRKRQPYCIGGQTNGK